MCVAVSAQVLLLPLLLLQTDITGSACADSSMCPASAASAAAAAADAHGAASSCGVCGWLWRYSLVISVWMWIRDMGVPARSITARATMCVCVGFVHTM